jgi:replicative DNA helicase
LWIADAGITMDRMVMVATRAIKEHDVALVIVDYAQIVLATGKDPRERVGNAANRLRRFAKDHHIAVLLLSQLARPEGSNLNHRPTMLDLKESGELKACAHTIILHY